MLNLINVLEVTDEATSMCMGIEVPNTLFNTVATVINFIKIAVPLLLIVWGMLDFAKAIIAKKEDDIKSHQKMFVSRVISAVLVFFIIFVVQLVFSTLDKVETKSGSSSDTGSIWDCTKKFINGVDLGDKEDSKEDTE